MKELQSSTGFCMRNVMSKGIHLPSQIAPTIESKKGSVCLAHSPGLMSHGIQVSIFMIHHHGL